MESWESIESAVDYIENHIASELSIEALAEVAHLSVFYFQKLFKRLVGKSVQEYIKLRRLAKASEEIKINRKDNILDICLRYGFENHETFSRNFKEAYGITPSEYRANPVMLTNFLKPEIVLQYRMAEEGVPIATNGIVLEVTRRRLREPKFFAGYTAQENIQAPRIDYLEKLWQKVHDKKQNVEGYIPEGNEIGVGLQMDGNNVLTYFAGFETRAQVQNEALETYTLAAGNYLVCQFEAENFSMLITDTIYKVYEYMHAYVSKKEIRVEPVPIEIYYGATPEITYMELWIPLVE